MSFRDLRVELVSASLVEEPLITNSTLFSIAVRYSLYRVTIIITWRAMRSLSLLGERTLMWLPKPSISRYISRLQITSIATTMLPSSRSYISSCRG